MHDSDFRTPNLCVEIVIFRHNAPYRKPDALGLLITGLIEGKDLLLVTGTTRYYIDPNCTEKCCVVETEI